LIETELLLERILGFRFRSRIAYHVPILHHLAAKDSQMATTPSPNDLTRQQLDELDTLLQRMLALPLNKPEPSVPYSPPPPLPEVPVSPVATARPAATNWRSDTPSSTAKLPYSSPESASGPVFQPFPTSEATIGQRTAAPMRPEPVRPESAPRIFSPIPAQDPTLPGGPGTLRGVDAPALPMGYNHPEPLQNADAQIPSAFAGMSFAEVNPFAEPPQTKPEAPVLPIDTRPVPILLWPLFATNFVIEFILGWFGPLGQLLTRSWMKTILGWVGLLLLVCAGWWVARGQGLVSWPR
jgi:hypothetical protein